MRDLPPSPFKTPCGARPIVRHKICLTLLHNIV